MPGWTRRWRSAGAVAEQPPIASRLAKQAVLVAEETALSPGIENERRLYELAMATEDRVEGMNGLPREARAGVQGQVTFRCAFWTPEAHKAHRKGGR